MIRSPQLSGWLVAAIVVAAVVFLWFVADFIDVAFFVDDY